VVGAVTATLHAVYLPLLRQLGTYAAVNLFTADPQVIKKDLDDFATKISAVEAADASAINTADAKPKVADTAPKAIAPGP
jgi:hypothetical protein